MRRFFIVSTVFFIMLSALSGCSGRRVRYGSIRVSVLDGFTDEPIPGACVIIPETGARYTSGADGSTPVIELPVLADSEYDRLLRSEKGRATVIVYSEGRTPCLMLYVRIEEGRCRSLTARMFPDDGSIAAFPVIESPDAGWCAELTEEYAPEN